MAVTYAAVNNVHGNPVHSNGTASYLLFSITGDGTGGDIAIPFGRLSKVVSVEGPYPYVISQSAKTVTVTVPSTLANGKIVNYKLNGF